MLVPREDPSAERKSTGEKSTTDLKQIEQPSTRVWERLKSPDAHLDLLLALISESVPPVLALFLVDNDGLVLLATAALAGVVAGRRNGLLGLGLGLVLLALVLVAVLPALVVGDAAPEGGGDGRCPIGLFV